MSSSLRGKVKDEVAIEWGKHGYSCWDDLKNDFILNPSSREIDNKDLLEIAERIADKALAAAAEEAQKMAKSKLSGFEEECMAKVCPDYFICDKIHCIQECRSQALEELRLRLLGEKKEAGK